MARNSARVSDRWREGTTVDMADEMMGLTLMVVAEALFSGDVEAEVEEIDEAMTAFMEWWYLSVLPAFPIIKRLPLPVNRRYAKTQGRLDITIYRLIKEHRERSTEGEDRGDLLTMLLQAQDAEGDGGMMTDKQVHDEAITLFTAGHETTGNALTWTWYLLSQHPEVEAKLHAELDEVLGGRVPTMEDLPKLQYTEMVFSEAMRLYPPAWGIDRTVVEDFEVGGYVIPKGAVITLNQYAMHRHPRYYPNPSKFDPMRWTPEEKAKRPKFAYFPFGGGARMCIGEQFAWMEGVLVLATLAQRWQARLAPGHKVGTQPLITLRAKGGMPMRLTQRQPAPARRVELEQVAAVT
jgi:cytochrome P450